MANRKKEVIDSPLKRTVTTRPRNDYARDYTPVRNTDRKSIDIRSDNKAAYQLSKYDSFDLTTALPSRNFLGTKYSFGQANYPMSSYTGTKPYQYLGVKNPQRYDLSRYR